jgi:hypothetical protein
MIKAEALSAETFVVVLDVLDVAEMEDDSFGGTRTTDLGSSDGLGLFLFGLA